MPVNLQFDWFFRQQCTQGIHYSLDIPHPHFTAIASPRVLQHLVRAVALLNTHNTEILKDLVEDLAEIDTVSQLLLHAYLPIRFAFG